MSVKSLNYRGRRYSLVWAFGEDEPRLLGPDGAISPRSLLSIPSRSALWDWLRANGISRPAPSGPSGRHVAAGRVLVSVRLADHIVADAKRCAEATGRDLRTFVEDALATAIDACGGGHVEGE